MRAFGASLVVLSMLIPTAAFAAGFANTALFLSKSPVTEGDTVHIYAVVANSGSALFSGTLAFKDGTDAIGSVKLSIDAGGAETASIKWAPSAGSHTITATLTDSTSAEVGNTSATFAINAKPKPVTAAPVFPTSSQDAAVDSSQSIQDQIGSFSPTAEHVAAPFFAAVDSLRGKAADLVDGQLAGAKANLVNAKPAGIVAGAATSDPQIQNPWGTAQFVLWTLYIYLLTIAGWLINNAGIFYPVLALLFLFILWRIFRRIRRPSY